jgi:hypothetical protein
MRRATLVLLAVAGAALPGAAVAQETTAGRTILVIGDSRATTVAAQLNVAFADAPDVTFTLRADGASGLVRDDYLDWPAAASALAADSDRPDALVVVLGLNDNQDMTVGGQSFSRRGEAWETAYRERIRALIEAAGAMEVFWLGPTPVANAALSPAMAYLDALYAQEVPAAGATYVEVWNAFADAAGNYTATGPDVEGRTVRLRLNDGIHYTVDGSRSSWIRRSGPGSAASRRRRPVSSGTTPRPASSSRSPIPMPFPASHWPAPSRPRSIRRA